MGWGCNIISSMGFKPYIIKYVLKYRIGIPPPIREQTHERCMSYIPELDVSGGDIAIFAFWRGAFLTSHETKAYRYVCVCVFVLYTEQTTAA